MLGWGSKRVGEVGRGVGSEERVNRGEEMREVGGRVGVWKWRK